MPPPTLPQLRTASVKRPPAERKPTGTRSPPPRTQCPRRDSDTTTGVSTAAPLRHAASAQGVPPSTAAVYFGSATVLPTTQRLLKVARKIETHSTVDDAAAAAERTLELMVNSRNVQTNRSVAVVSFLESAYRALKRIDATDGTLELRAATSKAEPDDFATVLGVVAHNERVRRIDCRGAGPLPEDLGQLMLHCLAGSEHVTQVLLDAPDVAGAASAADDDSGGDEGGASSSSTAASPQRRRRGASDQRSAPMSEELFDALLDQALDNAVAWDEECARRNSKAARKDRKHARAILASKTADLMEVEATVRKQTIDLEHVERRKLSAHEHMHVAKARHRSRRRMGAEIDTEARLKLEEDEVGHRGKFFSTYKAAERAVLQQMETRFRAIHTAHETAQFIEHQVARKESVKQARADQAARLQRLHEERLELGREETEFRVGVLQAEAFIRQSMTSDEAELREFADRIVQQRKERENGEARRKRTERDRHAKEFATQRERERAEEVKRQAELARDKDRVQSRHHVVVTNLERDQTNAIELLRQLYTSFTAIAKLRDAHNEARRSLARLVPQLKPVVTVYASPVAFHVQRFHEPRDFKWAIDVTLPASDREQLQRKVDHVRSAHTAWVREMAKQRQRLVLGSTEEALAALEAHELTPYLLNDSIDTCPPPSKLTDTVCTVRTVSVRMTVSHVCGTAGEDGEPPIDGALACSSDDSDGDNDRGYPGAPFPTHLLDEVLCPVALLDDAGSVIQPADASTAPAGWEPSPSGANDGERIGPARPAVAFRRSFGDAEGLDAQGRLEAISTAMNSITYSVAALKDGASPHFIRDESELQPLRRVDFAPTCVNVVARVVVTVLVAGHECTDAEGYLATGDIMNRSHDTAAELGAPCIVLPPLIAPAEVTPVQASRPSDDASAATALFGDDEVVDVYRAGAYMVRTLDHVAVRDLCDWQVFGPFNEKPKGVPPPTAPEYDPPTVAPADDDDPGHDVAPHHAVQTVSAHKKAAATAAAHRSGGRRTSITLPSAKAGPLHKPMMLRRMSSFRPVCGSAEPQVEHGRVEFRDQPLEAGFHDSTIIVRVVNHVRDSDFLALWLEPNWVESKAVQIPAASPDSPHTIRLVSGTLVQCPTDVTCGSPLLPFDIGTVKLVDRVALRFTGKRLPDGGHEAVSAQDIRDTLRAVRFGTIHSPSSGYRRVETTVLDARGLVSVAYTHIRVIGATQPTLHIARMLQERPFYAIAGTAVHQLAAILIKVDSEGVVLLLPGARLIRVGGPDAEPLVEQLRGGAGAAAAKNNTSASDHAAALTLVDSRKLAMPKHQPSMRRRSGVEVALADTTADPLDDRHGTVPCAPAMIRVRVAADDLEPEHDVLRIDEAALPAGIRFDHLRTSLVVSSQFIDERVLDDFPEPAVLDTAGAHDGPGSVAGSDLGTPSRALTASSSPAPTVSLQSRRRTSASSSVATTGGGGAGPHDAAGELKIPFAFAKGVGHIDLRHLNAPRTLVEGLLRSIAFASSKRMSYGGEQQSKAKPIGGGRSVSVRAATPSASLKAAPAGGTRKRVLVEVTFGELEAHDTLDVLMQPPHVEMPLPSQRRAVKEGRRECTFGPFVAAPTPPGCIDCFNGGWARVSVALGGGPEDMLGFRPDRTPEGFSLERIRTVTETRRAFVEPPYDGTVNEEEPEGPMIPPADPVAASIAPLTETLADPLSAPGVLSAAKAKKPQAPKRVPLRWAAMEAALKPNADQLLSLMSDRAGAPATDPSHLDDGAATDPEALMVRLAEDDATAVVPRIVFGDGGAHGVDDCTPFGAVADSRKTAPCLDRARSSVREFVRVDQECTAREESTPNEVVVETVYRVVHNATHAVIGTARVRRDDILVQFTPANEFDPPVTKATAISVLQRATYYCKPSNRGEIPKKFIRFSMRPFDGSSSQIVCVADIQRDDCVPRVFSAFPRLEYNYAQYRAGAIGGCPLFACGTCLVEDDTPDCAFDGGSLTISLKSPFADDQLYVMSKDEQIRGQVLGDVWQQESRFLLARRVPVHPNVCELLLRSPDAVSPATVEAVAPTPTQQRDYDTANPNAAAPDVLQAIKFADPRPPAPAAAAAASPKKKAKKGPSDDLLGILTGNGTELTIAFHAHAVPKLRPELVTAFLNAIGLRCRTANVGRRTVTVRLNRGGSTMVGQGKVDLTIVPPLLLLPDAMAPTIPIKVPGGKVPGVPIKFVPANFELCPTIIGDRLAKGYLEVRIDTTSGAASHTHDAISFDASGDHTPPISAAASSDAATPPSRISQFGRDLYVDGRYVGFLSVLRPQHIKVDFSWASTSTKESLACLLQSLRYTWWGPLSEKSLRRVEVTLSEGKMPACPSLVPINIAVDGDGGAGRPPAVSKALLQAEAASSGDGGHRTPTPVPSFASGTA